MEPNDKNSFIEYRVSWYDYDNDRSYQQDFAFNSEAGIRANELKKNGMMCIEILAIRKYRVYKNESSNK